MSVIKLRRGFRFHPTDEELITDFLKPKILETDSEVDQFIAEVDFYKFEPWDLRSESKIESENMWFFFCKPENYRGSKLAKRTTGIGFWKITSRVRPINNHKTKKCIGKKKTLVFHVKNVSASPGEGAKWVMQEYSVEPDNHPTNQSYVLCRLKKKPNDKTNSTPHSGEGKPSYNIVSEVENHETPAAFPQAHGHEEVTQKFIASGEQEESFEEIMNRLMADPDSQFCGDHEYVFFQSASTPRQRSGDGLLGSDMNTEEVIHQDSFQAQGDEVIEELRSRPLFSPVREEMGYHPFLNHIGGSALSGRRQSGYGLGRAEMDISSQSGTTTVEPQWNLSLPNNLDLEAEEHLEYGTAGRRRLQGATQELQASFSSTETPPNEVGEEAEMRNSISPSEYCFIVLFLIMILFTAFTLLVYGAWKLVRDISRKRKPFVVLCCAVSCYFLFFRNTSGVSHQHTVVSNPAARMLPE